MLKENQISVYVTRVERMFPMGNRWVDLLQILKKEQRGNYTLRQAMTIVETADGITNSKIATWSLQFPLSMRVSKIKDKLVELNGYYENKLAHNICELSKSLETSGRGKTCKKAF